jgi:hypothetical protein
MQCKYTWLPVVNLPGYMAPNYLNMYVLYREASFNKRSREWTVNLSGCHLMKFKTIIISKKRMAALSELKVPFGGQDHTIHPEMTISRYLK